MRNSRQSLRMSGCDPLGRTSSFPAGFYVQAKVVVISRIIARLACTALAFGMLPLLPDSVTRAETPPNVERQPSTPASDPYAGFVAEASQRFNIPTAWIRAVMRVESAGDRRATSKKGAMGLMQIMPPTWAELRTRHHLGGNPYDPRDNILAGAAYLRELHDRYGLPGFLAAYNAGPGRYEEHLSKGRALPAETLGYVAKLAPFVSGGDVGMPITKFAARSPSWNRATLFIAQAGSALVAGSLHSERRPETASAANRVRDISAIAPQSNDLFVRRPSIGRPQ